MDPKIRYPEFSQSPNWCYEAYVNGRAPVILCQSVTKSKWFISESESETIIWGLK